MANLRSGLVLFTTRGIKVKFLILFPYQRDIDFRWIAEWRSAEKAVLKFSAAGPCPVFFRRKEFAHS